MELESEYTISSPWILSMTAQQELSQEFSKACGGRDVLANRLKTPTNTFTMRCTEAVFIIFVETIRAYIARERDQESDIYEEPKITSVHGTLAFEADIGQSPNTHENEDSKLLNLDTAVQEWIPKSQDGSKFVKAYSALVGAVEALTSVRIEVSKRSHGVYVKGDDASSVKIALEKLGNLETYLLHKPAYCHFPILEGTLSPQMKIVSLEQLDDLTMRVLFNQHSSLMKSIPNLYVVAMVRNGNVVPKSGNPVPGTGKSNHLWSDHHLTVESVKKASEAGAGRSTISQWVEESASATNDPFAPMSETSEPPAVPVIKKAAKKGRIAKGEKQDAEKKDAIPDISTKGLMLPPEIPEKASTEAIGSRLQSMKLPPPISEPYMPFEKRNDVVEQPQSGGYTISNWGRPEKAPQSNDTLLDLDEEKHHTMRQKRPKQPLSGKQALVGQFHQSLTKVLVSSTCCPGSLKLKVRAGLLMMDNKNVADDFRDRVFGMDEWDSVFPPRADIEAKFISKLTSSHADIESILDLKLPRGRPLCQKEPLSRNVTYVFQCQSESGEKIMIEVGDVGSSKKGNYRLQGLYRLQGALNWHFVNRVWNARLELKSTDFIFNDSHEQAQHLAQSLSVSESPANTGGHLVSVSCKPTTTNFQVLSIHLRRETVHATPAYPDLLLHLTETQDLGASRHPRDQNCFFGTIEPQPDMIAGQRLWWELSISSQKASETLLGHSTELGGKATWNPRTLVSEEVVGDLYEMCCDLITRIDHVGLRNKRPAAESIGRKAPSGLRSGLSTETPVEQSLW